MKCKGSGDLCIATIIAADIEELGHGGLRVVLKADQEVAIAEVQREVVTARSGETVPTNSHVGESQSNGRVENAVQRVQGLIRTLKDALEIQHENQVKRPSIRVDGRAVSRTDHKICDRPKRQDRVQRGTRT